MKTEVKIFKQNYYQKKKEKKKDELEKSLLASHIQV